MNGPGVEHHRFAGATAAAGKAWLREKMIGLLLRDPTDERDLRRRYEAFVSIAAHELRTPLSTIVGFAELLLQWDQPEAVRREWLEYIHRDGQRLGLIVDELLNVSRIHSGELAVDLQELPLNSPVEEVLACFRQTTDAHEFVVDIPSDLPRVVADRNKLIQVLTNLLDNAVKYSPQGGRIALSATGEAGRVVVAVADQGVGMRLADQEHLFTTFHRIRRAETEGIMGTGLGLYIVKAFLELMHGEVWVTSELGRGSTFLFSLPARSADTVEDAA
jgi:signal transduction histidine kinase